MPVDPVCSMEVTDTDPGTTVTHDETEYHFCSQACRDLFEQNPDSYLDEPHPHLEEIQGVAVPRLSPGRAEGHFEIEIADPGALGVGDRVTVTKTITNEDVQRFAEATSDTNALHLNEDFARKTRFGGRITHGTLVSGLISSALACFPGVTIYLSQNLEFKRPVDIGETLTASCEIVEVLEDDEYRLTTRIENEAEKLVIHGTATVLVDELPK
ncbi:acyl dehydratase [Natrinema sp. CBA1119]|uniref:MaoC/PaaZ C-terminal domain-containing protein n=1 Tax=Natrinema sp. CBA1119 TaxID=1608465 RepID=UPI000BF9DB0A|nr:MaoC/PaaZ C-terminal domain-containing protein [Natrinema sp. CBA1119]PGF14164.1 acyl dehydratase [Natrinema sp. CBA1119]